METGILTTKAGETSRRNSGSALRILVSGLAVSAILMLIMLRSEIDSSQYLARAQAPPEEVDIVDMIDWDVLFENLSSTGIADMFAAHFDAGRQCRTIGQHKTFENGDERDYDVQAAFKASTGTRYCEDWTYEKAVASGSDPAVPPDTISSITETTPSSGPNEIILSTQLTYDFLLLVLESPPTMVSTQLSTKTLIKLWVEVEESTYYLFLKFEDSNENTTTKRVWSTYDGDDFGQLSFDN